MIGSNLKFKITTQNSKLQKGERGAKGEEVMVYLTEKEKKAIEELLVGLKKLYGENLSRVILYGSKARGEANEGSDIDIMIVLKEIENLVQERRKVSNLVWEICYKYDLLIAETIRTEEEYLTRATPFLLNVKREGIVL